MSNYDVLFIVDTIEKGKIVVSKLGNYLFNESSINFNKLSELLSKWKVNDITNKHKNINKIRKDINNLLKPDDKTAVNFITNILNMDEKKDMNSFLDYFTVCSITRWFIV